MTAEVCRFCREPILWVQTTWVHENGYADCGLVITKQGPPVEYIISGPNKGRLAKPPTPKIEGEQQ